MGSIYVKLTNNCAGKRKVLDSVISISPNACLAILLVINFQFGFRLTRVNTSEEFI